VGVTSQIELAFMRWRAEHALWRSLLYVDYERIARAAFRAGWLAHIEADSGPQGVGQEHILSETHTNRYHAGATPTRVAPEIQPQELHRG
jgi:hypothetical protein